MKRLFKVLLLACFVAGVLVLCGCQSKDKTQSFMTTGDIADTATFEYDRINDKTLVVWETKLENKTIYDFDSFKVTFELFSYGESMGKKIYTYEVGVKQGQEHLGRFNFTADGEITDIKFEKWNAIYSSFWDTYTSLLVITIIFVLLSVLAYGYIVFKNDLELASFDFEEFADAGGLYWLCVFLGLPTLFMVGFFFSPNWVFSLTFFLSLIAIAVLMFVVHCFHCFVKGFIEGWNEARARRKPSVVSTPIITQKPDVSEKKDDSIADNRIEDTLAGDDDSTDTTSNITCNNRSTK